ncbi:hypothetical protein RIF29_12404 [Crotalaria pallida]|uniref:Uncharacterized protein n=1 Tax=Crotalaria pallida TaxID=3830 RepID=A0AAN9IN92_CROPI
MTTLNDEWVRAAFNDDTLVVHLLLHLKKNPVSSSKSLQAQLPLKWGFKQPRSSSTSRPRLPPPPPPPAATAVPSASRCDGGGVSTTRCSPTTPLSWSGGASPSDTADGNEDSNRHHASRSKVRFSHFISSLSFSFSADLSCLRVSLVLFYANTLLLNARSSTLGALRLLAVVTRHSCLRNDVSFLFYLFALLLFPLRATVFVFDLPLTSDADERIYLSIYPSLHFIF